MECWPNAKPGERRQFEAIRILTSKNPHLIEFLFDENSPKLKEPPDELMKAAMGMSGSDFILVKLCLDLWCEQGQISVHELFGLDEDLFELSLKALAVV